MAAEHARKLRHLEARVAQLSQELETQRRRTKRIVDQVVKKDESVADLRANMDQSIHVRPSHSLFLSLLLAVETRDGLSRRSSKE